MFFLWLFRCCRSRGSLKWTLHKYKPLIKMATNRHTHNSNPVVYLYTSVSLPAGLISLLHLTTRLSLYLSQLHCHNTHTKRCCWLAHWLACLCCAAAVTFDIPTQLPEMSANYLHTMHLIPPPPFICQFASPPKKHSSFCCQCLIFFW